MNATTVDQNLMQAIVAVEEKKMTNAESQAWGNPTYREWFNSNIYNLAKEYASKHPIMGMEREDYVQELVLRVWQALPKYNPKKAKLSTFAFLWFSSRRYWLTDALIRRQRAMGQIESLDERVTESGCVVMDTVCAECPDYALEFDTERAYAMVGVESRMFYEGKTLEQIARKLKKPLGLVQEAIEADLEAVRREFGVESV